MNFDCDLILASNSDRRKELLKFITNDFRVIVSNVDEKIIENKILNEDFKENIQKYSNICDTLAFHKCKSVSSLNKNSLVIAADTVVFDENKLFGKPKNYDEAVFMLEYLSGKTHIVQTSVCYFYKGKFYSFNEKSYVTFNDLDDIQKELIKNYIQSKSPFDKAGGYGIQDSGNLLIKSFEGDFFNIVGLPVSKLYRHLYNTLKNNYY